MNLNQVIYTETTECRDCYKCVRNCPVKSIQVKNNEATVVPEQCIHCAKCVEVCPAQAKKIRNDLEVVKEIVQHNKTIALIAPSISAEFPNVDIGQLSAALQSLGFSQVSEVAHGAHIYSKLTEKFLETASNGVYLTSCCPVSLNYMLSENKDSRSRLLPFPSPLQLHIRYLKSKMETEYKYVFIGPCPGKKGEVELSDDLDASLTFQELHQWLEQFSVNPINLNGGSFLFNSIDHAHHYATVSGMFDSIRKAPDCSFLTVAGLEELDQIVYEFENVSRKVLVEILACPSGCIGGPSTNKKISTAKKQLEVLTRDKEFIASEQMEDLSKTSFFPKWPSFDKKDEVDPKMVERALHSVGKYRKEDELNCGGCGYDSCNCFAISLAQGMAERSMCVSYMRKLASNKAIKLMSSMPSAVVIVDNSLQVAECNKQFAALAGKEYREIFEVTGTLAGIPIKSIFPFQPLFGHVLSENDKYEGMQIFNNQTLKLTIFPIENKQLVGAVIQDITNPEGKKQQIIEKTQEVIQKNLQTVQQIAYLLGENAAESETILNSIVDAFRNNNE